MEMPSEQWYVELSEEERDKLTTDQMLDFIVTELFERASSYYNESDALTIKSTLKFMLDDHLRKLRP